MAIQNMINNGHNGVLLLAILEPLDGVQMGNMLRALLGQRTYLEWTNDQYGQKLFWEKLYAALNIPKRPRVTLGFIQGDYTGARNAAFEDVETAGRPSTSQSTTQQCHDGIQNDRSSELAPVSSTKL